MVAFEKVKQLYDRIRLINDEPREHAGLDLPAIREAFEEVGLEAPDILLSLYQWHNGIDYVNAFLHFPPLQDSLQSYESLAKHKDRWPDFEWERTYFPVLNLNADVLFCIDVETQALIELEVVDGHAEILASHYEKYVDAVTTAVSTGAAQFREETGAFEVNDEQWAQVAEAHKIRSAWW